MNAIERFEALLLEHEIEEQHVSLQKAQELLLKIARQQQVIANLKTQLGLERGCVRELTDRWQRVRILCGAEADDSVLEVYGRIKRANPIGKHQRQL